MPTRIKFKMIPAIETQLIQSGIENITSTPALRVKIGNKTNSIMCFGLIDTGSDICVLDRKLFNLLKQNSQRNIERVFMFGMTKIDATIEYLDFTLFGDKIAETMSFTQIPVAVYDSPRIPLILGRRGLLDNLSIAFDFPRETVTLTRPTRINEKYPALSGELSSFGEIMRLMETEGRINEGIARLTWELERFADRFLTGTNLPVSKGKYKTIGDATAIGAKFDLIIKLTGAKDIGPYVHQIVEARNIIIHGAFSAQSDKLIAETVLNAAEKVLSKISDKISPNENLII